MSNSQPPNTSYAELIESLHDYTRTVNIFKSKQSLKNYHSKFRQQLQQKLSKCQEKLCTKICNHIPSSLFAVRNFQIFPLLLSYHKLASDLKIPTTLYITEDKVNLFSFENKLTIYSGPEAIVRFLNTIQFYSDYPICCYKPVNGKISFIMTLEKLRSMLLTNNREKGYYQQFVRPCGGKASIMVAHSRKNFYSKYYVLHKAEFNMKNDMSSSDLGSTKISKGSIETKIPLYLKEHIELAKNTNFSMLNRKHTIEHRGSEYLQSKTNKLNSTKSCTNLIQRLKPKLIKTIKSPEELYIINPQNTKCLTPYTVKVSIPEVEAMIRKIFQILSNKFAKNCGKSIDELQLIFIKDPEKGWFFLKVEAIKLDQPFDYQEDNELTNICESSFKTEMDESKFLFNTSVIADVESPKQVEVPEKQIRIRRFSSIRAKNFKENDMGESLDAIDFARKRDEKRKKSRIDEGKSFTVIQNRKYELLINEAVLNYDIYTKAQKLCQKDICKFAQKYGAKEVWTEAAVKIHKSLLKSPLGKFFSNFNREKFISYSKSIEKILCCKIDSKYKKEMHLFHKGFAISNQDYDSYRVLFLKNIKKIVQDPKDLEIIMMNFDMLRKYIVEIE
ncbi:hypothetical protein SteCoe_21405 [Stentor coeruleus]|uniref:Uncharacterized protein n=1 Tax=Stentor coeruleus TaxID=5963 RepID=A0A1R2BPR9_9CILI|nr:hypothetical protein SteCoe_21405 [Stentor coeruleus]